MFHRLDKPVKNPQYARSFNTEFCRRSNTLANSAQAKKRAKQAETHRQRNAGQRSMMRTCVKNVVKAIDSGDKAAAEAAYKSAVPALDRMANKGLIHKNKAARHKSRLNQSVRAM